MHLCKGNYGPHTGQPRSQEQQPLHSARSSAPAGIGMPAGALRSNALLANLDDQDDVEGILGAVRKNVRGIQKTTAAARGRELDGRWCVKGHSVQIVVNDGAVMALGGQPQLITFEGPGKFHIDDNGTRVDGVLVGTEIHWSDGDVWIAMQEMGTRGREPAASSLSRNQSDFTHDRPRTREAKEAKTPRAQPKEKVKGRYVFSGGAESQVLGGQMPGGLARASSDFPEELHSQTFTPRKPTGQVARQMSSSSSQHQLMSRGNKPLPPLAGTPDCTDL